MNFSLDTIQCQSPPFNGFLIILTKSIVKKYGVVIPLHSHVTEDDLLPSFNTQMREKINDLGEQRQRE